jgi:signal transduction histidine kinase
MGDDEIGQLANSMGTLARSVRSTMQALMKQKMYLQDLMNGIEDALVVVGPGLGIQMTNRASDDEPNKSRLAELFQSEALSVLSKAVAETFQTGSPTTAEFMLGPDKISWELACWPVRSQEGSVARAVLLFRDVTNRKLLESQMNRADRLASVGQLAAGLAHEINNPLAAITTCVEGMERQIDKIRSIPEAEREEILEYLSVMGEASWRCKDITQGLLRSSKVEEGTNPEPVDLQGVFKKVLTLVEHQAREKKAQIATEFGECPRVLGHPGELSQLALNLLLNSLEAVQEGGSIRIATLQENGSVKLMCSDNGCGIPLENLERIFDPFFTTKTEGRGTGLGLSVCEGIVRRHEGRITVESQPGQGTRFTILFPSAGGSA